MMIAQRKIFLPNRIEKYNIVTLFQYVYKQKYGMLKYIVLDMGLKTEMNFEKRVVYLRGYYVLKTRYVVFLGCWVNVFHVD